MSDPLQLGPQKRRRINEWQVASNDMQVFPGPFTIVVHHPDELAFLLSDPSSDSSDSSDMDQSPSQLPPSSIWPTQNRQPKFQLFQNGEASPQQQQQQKQQQNPSNNSLQQPQQPSSSNNSNNGMQAIGPTSNQKISMFPQQQQQQQTSQRQSFDHFIMQAQSNSSTQPPTLLSQQPVNNNNNNTLPCTPAQESMSEGTQEPPTNGEVKSEIRGITDETTMLIEINVTVQKEVKEEASSPTSTNSESTEAIAGGNNGVKFQPPPSSSSTSSALPPPASTTITTTIPSTHPSPAAPLPPPTTGGSSGTASGSEQSKKKCLFQPDDLRAALMPILDKLIHQYPHSGPFLQLVDPTALGIPDYFDIIKKPMDLSTIRRNLEQGVYHDPWEYVDDVWLMFENAWLYNHEICRVYRYCTKLAELFEVEMDPVLQSLGCGRKYAFNTPTASSSTSFPLPPSTSTTTGSEQSKMKCLFQPDDLLTALMPTLDKLIQQYPQSGPFLQPVDPIVDRCSDYFDIIKKPMDLSKIRRKLEQGIYRDPWEYIDDVWLMFDNAWLYNRETSRVYRYCSKLDEVFQVEIEPVMQRLGYCCGRKYAFNTATSSPTSFALPPLISTTTTTTTPPPPSTHPSPAAFLPSPATDNGIDTAASSPEQSTCLVQPDNLQTALMTTLDKLIRQDPESGPFKHPVDPTALGIPDYLDIIKKPMDLSTIRRKLEQGGYHDPWEYVDDVWLMFDNAWLYNRETSKVYRYCTKLSEVFQVEIDPVMQRLGYCCGRKYKFNPQTLCCYGKQLCTIQRHATYYSYQNQYTFCQNCFNGFDGETVTIQDDDPTQPEISVEKSQCVELANEHCELEHFVECQECGRKFHQICVLHISLRGFTCDNCLKQNNWKRQVNKFTANNLCNTKLGSYIERRVNNFLKKKKTGVGHVYIRVVSSADKIVQVKPGMKSKFVDSGHFRETFPYKAKALFAFQKVDGVDVCFFGLHVQEYGSECPPPNSRRVYISYLDSVHFFQLRQYRTTVYHEILLGYLDYVRKLGYTIAHLWASPASEGDDYIFYCHPQDQKIPQEQQLQEWYKKMLDQGIAERIVLDYKNILEKGTLAPPTDFPYFEGDLWPTVIEDAIKELDQEEKKSQDEAAAASSDEIEVDGHTRKKKKKGHTNAKKSKRLRFSHRKNKNKSNPSRNDLFTKILTAMEHQRENFFVVRLHSIQSEASLTTIKDPDPCLSCDLMDGRDSFLSLARVNHYEFSSLRRAKFATLAMLYEIHNQGQEKIVYTCNNCENDVETRIHCTVCEDFDLCVGCFQNVGHRHKTILKTCSDNEKEEQEGRGSRIRRRTVL